MAVRLAIERPVGKRAGEKARKALLGALQWYHVELYVDREKRRRHVWNMTVLSLALSGGGGAR